jgi:hypothetical protein
VGGAQWPALSYKHRVNRLNSVGIYMVPWGLPYPFSLAILGSFRSRHSWIC